MDILSYLLGKNTGGDTPTPTPTGENNALIDFEQFDGSFNMSKYIKSVDLAGTQLTTLANAFNNMNTLTSVTNVDASKVKSLRQCFLNDTSLVTLPEMDTSACERFDSMCYGCTNLENVPVLSFSSLNNRMYERGFGYVPKLLKINQ